MLKNENVLECPIDLQDIYWKWLKQHGAWDFIEEIVEPYYPSNISIRDKKGSITIDRIGYVNLNDIFSQLKKYSIK
jgi:hypothetical protein